MQEHDMARSFGSVDVSKTMMRDEGGGMNGTSNGDPVDPTLRKRSLVDPSLRKRDSIEILGSSQSQVPTCQQAAINIRMQQDKTVDSGTTKRDSLRLNLAVESNETNAQVEPALLKIYNLFHVLYGMIN